MTSINFELCCECPVKNSPCTLCGNQAVQKNATNGKKNGIKKPKQPVETSSKAAETKIKPTGTKARTARGVQAQRKKPAVATTAANSKLKPCKEKRAVETEVTASQELTTSSSQESATSADANISDISMADLDIRSV